MGEVLRFGTAIVSLLLRHAEAHADGFDLILEGPA
jgi:hypothetical protein